MTRVSLNSKANQLGWLENKPSKRITGNNLIPLIQYQRLMAIKLTID